MIPPKFCLPCLCQFIAHVHSNTKPTPMDFVSGSVHALDHNNRQNCGVLDFLSNMSVCTIHFVGARRRLSMNSYLYHSDHFGLSSIWIWTPCCPYGKQSACISSSNELCHKPVAKRMPEIPPCDPIFLIDIRHITTNQIVRSGLWLSSVDNCQNLHMLGRLRYLIPLVRRCYRRVGSRLIC